MADAKLDGSALTVDRTFTFPDATGTLALVGNVGTVTTGVWHGTIIAPTWGGTGSNLSATGGTSQVVMQITTGANFTVRQLALADLSDASTITLNTQIGFDDPGISSPTTGDTVGCGGPQLISQTAIRGAGGTLSALTLNFVDGISNSVTFIKTTRAVTALTVTGNVNLDVTRTVVATPTALTAGQLLIAFWDDSATPACWEFWQ